jgi:hypothetical protein
LSRGRAWMVLGAGALVIVGAAGVWAWRSSSTDHHAAPAPILSSLESHSPPGTTFCDLRRAQPSVASSLTRIAAGGKQQWIVENISAANLARLAPPEVRAAAHTFAAAVAAWPKDHQAIDAASVVAGAHALDLWTVAHCH